MHNAYEKRRFDRTKKKRGQYERIRSLQLGEAEQLCKEYQVAYAYLYGIKPTCSFLNGWYKTGSRNYRRDEFIKVTNRLHAIRHEIELGGNEDGP